MEQSDVGCRKTSLALGSILCSLFITNSLTLLLSLSEIWTSEGRFTLTLVILVPLFGAAYRIIVPLFGAAYAAPNKGTTILYLFSKTNIISNGKVYLSSYSPLNEGHLNILTNHGFIVPGFKTKIAALKSR